MTVVPIHFRGVWHRVWHRVWASEAAVTVSNE
jgi:hypothetical protein